MLIDTHSHLYLKQFAEDREAVLQRAYDQGVEKIFLPSIDSSVLEDMLKLEAEQDGKCYAMMGLHPCSVKDNYKKELDIVHEWLDRRYFCAVGEIGMDLYWDKTFVKEQEEAFIIQLNWAVAFDIPIVIHSRSATDEIINILKKEQKPGLRGIFHCFGGSIEQAKAIIDLGFYLGIGGVVTFKNAGLAEIIKDIDLEHIVLETDAPYLAPVPYRGKRNESAYIYHVAQHIAKLKELDYKTVSQITTENALKIFEVA